MPHALCQIIARFAFNHTEELIPGLGTGQPGDNLKPLSLLLLKLLHSAQSGFYLLLLLDQSAFAAFKGLDLAVEVFRLLGEFLFLPTDLRPKLTILCLCLQSNLDRLLLSFEERLLSPGFSFLDEFGGSFFGESVPFQSHHASIKEAR
ncbi:MAG: hypothetical protein DDT27_01027 [Dehalococcoidia bacterium]|nr:hypothetical protein [Chloroflexota bacterium]MBT9160006.1 hypothetical protein [Chloroflexota bacterium]MBT9162469.1 hypothetical protein [Chloroflexota bacterium]